MALIEAKCPECGATLKISDQAAGELTCPYCGSKYLAEKVTQINSVSNSIAANEVVINNEKNYEEFTVLLMNRKRIGTDSTYSAIIRDQVNLYVDDSFYAVLELEKPSKVKLDLSTRHILHLKRELTFNGSIEMYDPLHIEKDEKRRLIGAKFKLKEKGVNNGMSLEFVDSFDDAETMSQCLAFEEQKKKTKIVLIVLGVVLFIVFMIIVYNVAYYNIHK